jgi:hypothetical protein
VKTFFGIVVLIAVVAAGAVVLKVRTSRGDADSPAAAPPGQPDAGGGDARKTTSEPDKPAAGRIDTTFRGTKGSDRVSCGSISTEFKISADSGAVTWTAQPRDRHPGNRKPYAGSTADGVSVSPSSGSLRDGGSVVVTVRGSFEGGKEFYVVVEPNGEFAGTKAIAFACR